MVDFCMPSLGADMESGTIIEWKVAPGDPVTRGQIVAEVETEKANIEIEIFQTGQIGELLVPVGVEVPVGTPLATVVTASAVTSPPTPRVTSPIVRHLARELHVDLDTVTPTGRASTITRADVERAAAGSHEEPSVEPRLEPTVEPSVRSRPATLPQPTRPRVSPRARKLAGELGIDPASLAPRQAGAAITAADLPATRPQPTRPTVAPSTKPAGLSAAVGRLMERSKREIPHYYVSDDIDMSATVSWLERTNSARPVDERILPAALLLRAVVLAAQEVPEMNGHFVGGAFVASDAVHLGVAVSLRNGGLIAPVIRDAHAHDLSSLMAAMRDVVARARSGTLRGSDVEAATITVTNLGDRGAASVFGVIIPPQVAIVGFGRVTERPWALDGMVGARPVVTATLSADHRVSHGHTGARFLAIVGRHLSKPEDL